MDKMSEEFEKFNDSNESDFMDNEDLSPEEQSKMVWEIAYTAGYQASTAEAEKYREALQEIANHSLPSDRNPFAMQNIASRAIQK